MTDQTGPAPRHAAAARIAGLLLLLVFAGLGASSNGLHVTFQGTQTSSSPGELNFWLGQAFLLVPAALLVGYGLSRRLYPLIHRVTVSVLALNARERRVAVIAITLLAAAIARVGHALVLLDLPITDDEYAVDFGGRILASGHVMTRLAIPPQALPDLFLYVRDGAVGSFDWIGGQAVAAIAHLTALGPFLWALLAAVPVLALAVLMARRLGPHWGLAAGALFACSPMALLMSLTTHAQLGSRAFLSLGILAFWQADRDGGLRRWVLAGCWLGLASIFRPIEMVFFCAPLVAWTLYQSMRRSPTHRRALAGLVLGGAAFGAILLWHSYAMTGNPLLPARFAVAANTDIMTSSLRVRIGENVSYNAFMLAVWFLGPLGLVLLAAGAMTDRFTRLLGACVMANLALAFFHDNPGLHIVGPIHYTECAAPLTVIATHGLANLLRGARRHAFDSRVLASAVAGALVLGLGTFDAMQAFALRGQANVQRAVYRAIEGAVADGSQRVVVFAPWMFAVVNAVPALRDTGTWVHDWRRPQLDLGDGVLFLRNAPAVEANVRRQLPDRRFFTLQRDEATSLLVLVPLDGGSAIPLTALGATRP